MSLKIEYKAKHVWLKYILTTEENYLEIKETDIQNLFLILFN